jgi:cobalt-zinc-cadmium efflux system outer membrane protein
MAGSWINQCLLLSLLAASLFLAAPNAVAQVPHSHSPAEEEIAAPADHPEQGLTLADLERLALQRNPTLVQAAAQIQSARGRALQAGLPFNPTIGYTSEQIGVLGTAGELHGGFIQQEIVTAGKLRLSRAKYQQEAYQATLQAVAQELRVVNSIHLAFYDVLATQRLLEVQRELAENAQAAVTTTEQLFNVGQANEPDRLQAEIDVHRELSTLKGTEAQHFRNWQQLIALVGAPELPLTPLIGSFELDDKPLDWESELARLLAESPELNVARSEVSRDRITVTREQVESIPNIVVQGTAGYNFEAEDDVYGAQVSLVLPLFDKNQGTIREARGELMRAQAEVNRLELDLRRRLADAFYRYEIARTTASDYRDNSLPKARRAYELYTEYFNNRRATWPQVLVAQRTYAQMQEDNVNTLIALRRARVEIEGMLLIDGLVEPPAPTPQGHIESTPRPR